MLLCPVKSSRTPFLLRLASSALRTMLTTPEAAAGSFLVVSVEAEYVDFLPLRRTHALRKSCSRKPGCACVRFRMFE